jgi:hypothetical protein
MHKQGWQTAKRTPRTNPHCGRNCPTILLVVKERVQHVGLSDVTRGLLTPALEDA